MVQLLIMNGMGSLFYTLHMFFHHLEQKFMVPKYRLFIYRLNLLLFVIPFPSILFYIRRYFDSFISKIPVSPFYHNGSHIIVHFSQKISFALPRLHFVQILFLIAWILAMIIISVYVYKDKHKTYRYDSFFRIFGEEEMAKSSIDIHSLLDAALKEMNMKKKPRIYIHEKVSVPYVSGVFQPAIYLPSHWDVPEQVYYMSIKHELAHIKHKDLLFEYISQFAGIINCFNPLLDRLYSNIKTCEELAADACACEGASWEDRRAYQIAILNLSATNSSAPSRRVRGLIFKRKCNNNTKERILTMKNMNLNKHKLLKLAATALMSATIFTVSAIPALAYTLPSPVKNLAINPIDTINVELVSTDSLQPTEDELNSLFENVDYSKSDFVCIDENGTITYGSAAPHIFECKHNYLAAQVSHHNKNSDGSCTITYYSAKRCSKCGEIVVGDRIATMTYVNCPH